MFIRGKWLAVSKHASHGMNAERPPVRMEDIAWALEEPDHDTGCEAFKWIADRTIIVRYRQDEEEIVVQSVSATSSRLAP